MGCDFYQKTAVILQAGQSCQALTSDKLELVA